MPVPGVILGMWRHRELPVLCNIGRRTGASSRADLGGGSGDWSHLAVRGSMEAVEDRRAGGAAAVKARGRALAADLDVHEMDERRQLPPRLLERLNATGIRGMHVPVAFGGSDLGYRGCVEVIEQMAAIDVDIA